MHFNSLSITVTAFLSLCASTSALPIVQRQSQPLNSTEIPTGPTQSGSPTGPSLDQNFPDPSFITVDDVVYAFATSGQGKHVQMASSPSFSNATWTMSDVDPLPDSGPWTDQSDNIWAPSVMKTSTGSFVMYYSGPPTWDLSRKCIGAATATTVSGPYTPQPTPLVCSLDQGGAIDPTFFVDPVSGNAYIAYKIDGNSLGPGTPTPIMLQQVDGADGVSLIGSPVQIYTQNPDGTDGPLVEAPTLVYNDGVYFLLISTHMYDTPEYDVRYTTATSLTGPYNPQQTELLVTGNNHLGAVGPGGADVHDSQIMFHGIVDYNPLSRNMYTAYVQMEGTTMSVALSG